MNPRFFFVFMNMILYFDIYLSALLLGLSGKPVNFCVNKQLLKMQYQEFAKKCRLSYL